MEKVKLKEIIKYYKNTKKHPKEQINKIKKSISEFGYIAPVIIDKKNNIIAGHGRVIALEELGHKEIDVLRVEHLTDAQIKAYRIADNKLAESEWDEDLLKDEFNELKDMDFDLSLTGFDLSDVESYIRNYESNPEDDEIPEEVEPICKKGEIWQLGEHRLMCGDATKKEDVAMLMLDEKADMCFTDPPYNVAYGWNKFEGSPGKFKNREIKNDNLSEEDWLCFVEKYMGVILQYCHGGVYICMSNKEMYSNQNIFIKKGGHWSSFIIWDKNFFVLSRQDYHRQFEPILYGWNEGTKKKVWNGQRNKCDLWRFDRPTSNKEHPTMKPIVLVETALFNSSNDSSIVIDLFGGSGSTLIACEKTNRKCRMMEIDPHYSDVIIKRWEEFTGNKAIKLS